MGKSLQPAFFLIVWHLKKSAQSSLPKAGRGWASSNARTPGGRFLVVASAGSGRSPAELHGGWQGAQGTRLSRDFVHVQQHQELWHSLHFPLRVPNTSVAHLWPSGP